MGDIFSAKYDDSFFDVVTLFQVFEHIENPSLLITEIYRILKPNGYLIFETPNFNSSLSHKYMNSWASLEFPRHLIIHSPNSIYKLLSNFNFNIKIKIRTSPTDIKNSAIRKFSMTDKNWLNIKIYKLMILLDIIFNILFKNKDGSLLMTVAQKKII